VTVGARREKNDRKSWYYHPHSEVQHMVNGESIDRWSEKHVGSLALTRTIVGFVNVALSVIVVAKLFGWI